MPTIHIYQGEQKVVSKDFLNGLYIIKDIDSDDLYWKTDNDKQYHKVHQEQIFVDVGGALQIWILGASSNRPTLKGVLPDWTLIIDGVEMEQKFYDRFEVPGRTIELRYREYRFICTFPGEPQGSVMDVIRPAPLKYKNVRNE